MPPLRGASRVSLRRGGAGPMIQRALLALMRHSMLGGAIIVWIVWLLGLGLLTFVVIIAGMMLVAVARDYMDGP